MACERDRTFVIDFQPHSRGSTCATRSNTSRPTPWPSSISTTASGFGDGTTRRDYTYVDDIVDGVVAAVDRCEGYEIYNLGESATTSLSELVELIGAACGREPVLDRQPLQPGDVLVTYADVDKARERLGYEPSTSVAEGLGRYLAWLRAQPDAPREAAR